MSGKGICEQCLKLFNHSYRSTVMNFFEWGQEHLLSNNLFPFGFISIVPYAWRRWAMINDARRTSVRATI